MDKLTTAFFVGLTDELEKKGGCDTPGEKIRSGGEGLGLAIGGGKGPLRGRGGPGRGLGIRAKIEAARRDPSTKANPKDTGPKGSGTQDPRFKAMKKKAEAFFSKEAWGGGKAKAEELNKHINAAGGSISGGVKAYNEAKKGKKGKKALKKTAEEVFFDAFDEGMGKKALEEKTFSGMMEGVGKPVAHFAKKFQPKGKTAARTARKAVLGIKGIANKLKKRFSK